MWINVRILLRQQILLFFINIIKIIYISWTTNRGLNLRWEKNQGSTYLAWLLLRSMPEITGNSVSAVVAGINLCIWLIEQTIASVDINVKLASTVVSNTLIKNLNRFIKIFYGIIPR